MIAIESIQRMPRFAGISEEAQDWLAERLVRKPFKAGEILFYEGDACEHLYLVEHGTVKIARHLESGRELILGMFQDGEAIGEVALIDGLGYPATATAHDPSTVLILARTEYMEGMHRFPELPLAVIRDLTLRMRTLSRRVEDLGGGGVEFRLARLLLALGHHWGRDSESGLEISVGLTRQELANFVGARIETVIRIMSKWQREGILVTESDGFTILAPDELESLTAA